MEGLAYSPGDSLVRQFLGDAHGIAYGDLLVFIRQYEAGLGVCVHQRPPALRSGGAVCVPGWDPMDVPSISKWHRAAARRKYSARYTPKLIQCSDPLSVMLTLA